MQQLPREVTEWVMRDAAHRVFDMPGGAGSLRGADAIDMLARGIDPHSDYTEEGIVHVLTEAFEQRVKVA